MRTDLIGMGVLGLSVLMAESWVKTRMRLAIPGRKSQKGILKGNLGRKSLAVLSQPR